MSPSIYYYELMNKFLFIANYVNLKTVKVNPLAGYVSTILFTLNQLAPFYPYVLANTNRETVNELKGT
ncbi:MAG: hypothetical protein NOOUEUKL_001185 [Candidatus Fervidibacter sp.]